jgi:SAM-dependent methyltransferase
MSSAAVWQEVECGAYTADLATWERLAEAQDGPVLELGGGGGRVALHLARRGHQVWAVEENADLVDSLAERAASEHLAVHTIHADVASMELDRDFGLALAPMQLMQVLGGREKRIAALERAAVHLRSGGRLAAAIADAASLGTGSPSPIPDIGERDGWVYSSRPVAMELKGPRLEVRRIRQAVSPDGSLVEADHVDYLDLLDAAGLEAEAEAAGLHPVGRLSLAAENGYVGSTVVIVERP